MAFGDGYRKRHSQVRHADEGLRFLDRLEPNEARKTLGVFVAPDGNWKRQKDSLDREISHVRGPIGNRNNNPTLCVVRLSILIP